MHDIQVSPLLRSFEDLGALSEASGLIDIKPFKDWKGSAWKDKVFSMRLCNAGELLDIGKYVSDFPESSRTQATRIELLIRSIWQIDGRSLVTPEELQTYNETNRTQISSFEFLRVWIRNLEQIVVDRLDSVYGGLQLKQIRRLQSTHICEICATTYEQIPEGSVRLRYSLSEIICPVCLQDVDLHNYDVVTVEMNIVEEDTKPVESKGVSDEPSFTFQNYVCECGEELESIEAFAAHRETCPKAKKL